MVSTYFEFDTIENIALVTTLLELKCVLNN